MGTVMFYHLIRGTAAETLAVNAPRALAHGWRVMVRGTDVGSLDGLDGALWTLGGDESFLPHGLAGGPHDAAQPVLLGTGLPVNGAKVLALVDGAGAEDAEIAAMERVWILFDGQDNARVEVARDQWKAVTAAGHAAQYWSDESGRWVMKSESQTRPSDQVS